MGSFSHAREPQSFLVILLGENCIHIKSLTTVLNDKFYPAFIFLQDEVDKSRFAMFGNIVKGFLQNPIHDGLYGVGNEIDILNMVKKYLQKKNEGLKGQKMEGKMSN